MGYLLQSPGVPFHDSYDIGVQDNQDFRDCLGGMDSSHHYGFLGSHSSDGLPIRVGYGTLHTLYHHGAVI